MANGWADLGSLLTGGVQREAENAYIPQLRANGLAYQALEEAKIKRHQAMARDSLPQAMERLGYTADHATIMQANAAPSISQLGALVNPNYVQAQEASYNAAGLNGGVVDLGAMNRAQSVATSKPLNAVAIDDGYKINKFDPNAPIELTDVGSANLGAINARANASNASASNSSASAKVNAQRVNTEVTKQDANKALSESRRNPKDKKPKTKDRIYNPKTGKIE